MTKIHAPLAALMLSVVLASGCAQPAPAPADTTADIAKISELRTAYQAAIKSGDAEAITNLYAADGIALPAGRPPVVGRDALLAYNKEQVAMGPMEIVITAEETKVMGDWAYDRGTFSMTMTPASGPAMKDQGKYLVLLAKQADGSWKVAREIGSSDTAMAAMMASMTAPAAGAKPAK